MDQVIIASTSGNKYLGIKIKIKAVVIAKINIQKVKNLYPLLGKNFVIKKLKNIPKNEEIERIDPTNSVLLYLLFKITGVT